MNKPFTHPKFSLFLTFFGLTVVIHLLSPYPILADLTLLQKIIIPYNLKTLKKSLNDGDYRGEEGILRIGPMTGKALGMKVFIDENYRNSTELFQKADEFLEEAKKYMASREKEKFPGEFVQKIADSFLLYKKSSDSAKKEIMIYRSRLNPDVDDRLNDAMSTKVMDRLLEESLRRTDNRLRDALGHFYNICQGTGENGSPLTWENVRFVNHVFLQFLEQAPQEALNKYNLDRDYNYHNMKNPYDWKNIVNKRDSKYNQLLEVTFNRLKDKIYNMNPLLFISLIKNESNFDPLAISSVGAAGLTQIMPKTAKDLGMKNIYMPAYFVRAGSIMENERKMRRQAMAALFQINGNNRLHFANRARELMQKSLNLGDERANLFSRYSRELLQKRTDDRLQPALAIEYGLRYFSRLMMNQNGDISLALASYNAGPHRVQQFKGIPPYKETVRFRNRVLNYYHDYMRKAKGTK